MTNSMSPALQIEDLHCSYAGVEILNGLDLTLDKNEILCLLGPSGCGKTTTLKLIAGLLAPTQGKITVDGLVVDDQGINLSPESRNVGMIFQDYALFPHLTVMDNVLFGIQSKSKTEQAKTIDYVLNLVNLSDFANRYPHQLSGGQQQRVAIARALACSPALLLLDEPFSNIDSQVRHHLIEEMRELLKSHNMSAVFVTHSKEEAFAFADRLAVFNRGRIEQIGTPSELYNQPKTQFVADFLGKVNYLDATVVDRFHVDTALGRFKSSQAIAKSTGSTAKLALRPHQCQLQLDKGGTGEIIQQQFLGMSTNMTAEFVAGAEPISLFVSMKESVGLGSKVSVHVSEHELVLF